MLFIFVGRIVRPKGVVELLEAFQKAQKQCPDIFLLFVGPQEEKIDGLDQNIPNHLRQNIVFIGESAEPEKYIAVSDVLCIPSYREGFGTVVLECAAFGLPSIGSKIYGLNDAIINNETGLLVEVNNPEDLAQAMQTLAQNKTLRQRLGYNARKRVSTMYSSSFMDELIIEEYLELLGKLR